MGVEKLRRIIGGAIFLFSFIIFFITAQPSVSLWDPGEIASASYSLMVPHPPGGPFWLLIGHIFSMIPFAHDIGFRINIVSVLSSALAVTFLYLIAIRLIQNYRGKNYQNTSDALVTYLSAAVGALALAFCDTFWFNAVEANYFGLSTFMFSLAVWMMMVWYQRSNEPGNEKYILLIAYITGLAVGVHLMSVLAIFAFVAVVVMKKYVADDEAYKKSGYIFLGHMAVLLIVAMALWSSQTSVSAPSPDQYNAFNSKFIWIMIGISAVIMLVFRKKVFSRNSFYLPLIIGGIALGIVYPGIVKIFPELLLKIGGPQALTNLIIFLIILAVLGYITYWSAKNKKSILHIAVLSLLFAMIGYTTYAMIIIRANQNTPMNENNPSNFSKLVYYLDREQYGDFPIFKRRFSPDPAQQGIYTDYSSDLDFWWNYQMNHMFNRYLLWNFAGRESTVQDSGVKWNEFFAIPLLVGLLGLYFHFRKDWKLASVFLILFIIMGYLIAFYQNQQQPQPRERDYFYAGAYFIFSIWIALGTRELIQLVRDKISSFSIKRTVSFGLLLFAFILIPFHMLAANYFTHNRSNNWLPWDEAYNLLQSCKPNAILFTGGDNDTFPLWFLQYVEGIRRDVRIACLSLANTDWYLEQLKNTSPYGAEKVAFGMSDQAISNIQIQRWTDRTLYLNVPEDVMKKYNVTDSTELKTGRIAFTMRSTLRFGDVSAIRVQDIAVRDIIMANAWKRPIYFATTCSPDSYIGLDNYLQLEGLALRLVPKRNPNNSEYINREITTEDLLHENPSYSKTYKPGFKFRGLNNPDVFFDSVEGRIIQNYRNIFVRLAIYYQTVMHDNKQCIAVLDSMESKISRKVVPMDYRYVFDVANIYRRAGDTAKFEQLAKNIEKDALADIEAGNTDISRSYNPYVVLERLYITQKEYDKAIGVLKRLQEAFPGAADIANEIKRLQMMKQSDMSIKKDTAGNN